MSLRPRRNATDKKKVVYTEEKDEDELDLSDSETEAADEFVPEKLDLSDDSDSDNDSTNSGSDDNSAGGTKQSKGRQSKPGNISFVSLKQKLAKNNASLMSVLNQASTSSFSFTQIGKLSDTSDSEDEERPQLNFPANLEKEEADVSDSGEIDPLNGDIWSQQLTALGLVEPVDDSEKPKKKEKKIRRKKESNKDINDVSKLLTVGEKVEEGIIPTAIAPKTSTSGLVKEEIQVTIPLPELKRSKKQKADLQELLKKHLRKLKKDLQANLHKTHICCLIAHGLYLNKTINSDVLKATAMSVLPFKVPEKSSLSYVENLLRWYNKKYFIAKEADTLPKDLQSSLEQKAEKEVFYNQVEFVLFFLLILRTGGVDSRLVFSLQPVKLKVQNDNDSDMKTKGNNEKRKHKPDEGKKTKNKKVKSKKEEAETSETDSDFEEVPEIIEDKKPDKKKGRVSQGKSAPAKSKTKELTKKDKEDKELKSQYFEKLPRKLSNVDSEDEPLSKKLKKDEPPILSPQKTKSKHILGSPTMPILQKAVQSPVRNGKVQQKMELEVHPESSAVLVKKGTKAKQGDKATSQRRSSRIKHEDVKKEDLANEKQHAKIGEMKSPNKFAKSERSLSVQKNLKQKDETSGSKVNEEQGNSLNIKTEPDIVVNNKRDVKKPNVEAIKNLVQKKSQENLRRMLSSDEEGTTFKKAYDYWVEAYLDQESKWCPIDVRLGKVFCEKGLEARATQPIQYVLAFNSGGKIKDVTSRYASDWLTQARKRRVDEEWLEETLAPFKEMESARSKKEDADLRKTLMEKPIPSSISELKSHPLYALERHLLKFEAIYPKNAVPLGYIKGEPVYARERVHTLHSRETWIKQAKVVRIGEQPYKIVKARPKWDKFQQKMLTDKPLEVFGEWQTEDYVPPVAVDGRVPRNDYGNVELFKPSMLPVGCVHLPQMPGLNRIAKKLDIDCAPAMVGWDFHSGGSHPVFDGWVICEEYQETLLDAWQTAELEAEKREKENREKRVIANWRKLIRFVLIRERLNQKYNLKRDS